MNKNYIFGIGIALAVLLVFAAPTMARTDDVTFYLNASDGSHEVSVAPGEEVTIYLDAYAPVNTSAGFEVGVMIDPDVLECLDVTENTSLTNWYMWTFRGVWDSGFGDGKKYINFDSWDTLGIGPGHLRCGDMRVKGVNPGTTILYLGVKDVDIEDGNNNTIIIDTEGDFKDWTLAENFTFTCVGSTYTISGYTNPAADKVNITNMDESKGVDDRKADYIDPLTGFYNLTLNVPDEVDTNDVLRIITCDVPDNYTSNCNVTDHTVDDIGGEENVNLTLNHYCQNYYPSFPFHTWEESDWSGPAAMEMLIDNYRDTSDVPSQTVLNATGLGYNQAACNADILFVDPLGMKSTLNQYLHAYEGLPYVANYGIGSYDSIEEVLHYICKWQYLGPGAAPAYGNYSNWMVIRGIHTNKTPSFTQGTYEIYGFWVNDPYNASLEGPGGIGENTYKSVDQWSSIYHKKLSESGVNTSDNYYNRYVAVCEPPEDDDVVVTLAHAKPRFADAIAPMLAEEPMMVYGIEQLAIEKVVKDDESLKIVKAAIDGVTEELVPYDAEFAAVFAKTVPGKPMLVTSDLGNYYVVPFNVPAKVRPPVKRMPVEIERPKMSGLRKLERVKNVAANAVIEPIVIEPIKVERTLVVVLVDAVDGSFKEASWVADPVKYLPVSKVEALKIALGEIAITSASDLSNLGSKPAIKLVYAGESPYYPDWKVTVGGTVFYVSQDGTVSA